MPQPTSIHLWQQYKSGDPKAFSRLYGEYVQVLYAQGLRVTPDAGLVKDCIHDLFVDLWRNRQRIPNPESVSVYLTEALRNGLSAKLGTKPGSAPTDEPAPLPHAPLPVERNPIPRRQPVGGWPVQVPVSRPEVMSLPGYGEAAPQGVGAFSFFAKAFKTLQGILLFH
jgi:hypothetical protein